MKRLIALLALATALGGIAVAEDFYESDGVVYRINDTDGNYITSVSYPVSIDDEYISGDDKLYRVIEVSSDSAVAEYLGYEPATGVEAFAFIARAETEPNKLICMYSTHSDESYEPTDGAASLEENAGIYDVGEAFKQALEEKGITVEYSKDTFLPHDSGAYRRSRSTAEELLKMEPAALFDLHRDGIPDPDEYEQEINGEEASMVRLLVGRSNANADANRAFAKQIKSVADEEYPELIKDIYIGKGNYNQELYPRALLLEFGTHTIDKERAIASTKYVSEVVNEVLFGDTAQAQSTEKSETSSAWSGIGWIIGIALLAAVIYALVGTGTFKGMGVKLKRGVSEITGGLIGKKPKDKE
ncbi:MAG: stage II sporulation protein P [Clostridia bacterium]|nr:stage II sporulation protein P [Clostridia bacterium]